MLYPKIGIRPVIDGRWGGVRESLENQTMRMAENAAKLISENLKYPDGTPVQCVIGCTTIGGGAEAARVAEQFSTQNVTATLSVTPCWCYGTETFDMDPNTIKAVWGFNGTERPGAVYLAAVLAAHAQRGLPAFSIYGHDVQEANDDTIPDLHLTVSIGGVYGACTLDPGIRQADKLLYQAKESRNKCITAAFSAEEAEEPKPNQESDKL